MSHDVTTPPTTPHELGHTPDAIWSGTIAALGIGLLVLIILAMIGAWSVFHWMYPGPSPTRGTAQWHAQNLIPGVEPNQAYGRARLLAEERAQLQQYGWQDKERGMARIPIDRGIELMAQRDLHVEWPASDEASNADPVSAEGTK